MSKPQIPDVPRTPDVARARFDRALRENLQILTGRSGDVIEPVATTATLEEVITALNAIIARLH